MPEDTETLKGYVVDIARLRKYPRAEWDARARVHPRQCALMRHCVESGYGLVSDGTVALLDHGAIPFVVDALHQSTQNAGIRLRVRRRWTDSEMRMESAHVVE